MTDCPHVETLEQFLAEQVADADRTVLVHHIEVCVLCQRTLERLTESADTDKWCALLRSSTDDIEERAAGGRGGVEKQNGAVGETDRPSIWETQTDGGPNSASPADTDDNELNEAFRWRLEKALLNENSATEGKPQPTVAGYEIVEELGRGGMGVVYKAHDLRLNRVVALKMLLADRHAGEKDKGRFRREAESLAQIQHPNIVQIFEVSESEGRLYLSLEFVDGGNLAQVFAGSPQPAAEAAQLVEILAKAVHAAHAVGIIHRDLKPANVLLAEEGTPKITDFGLAKSVEQPGNTHSDEMIGTPSYMAPEQVDGGRTRVSAAVDVYALGAILYEALTGRPPFQAPKPLDTLLQVRRDEPVPPQRLQPKLPKDLETICLKCLRKRPEKRYGSAESLASDLRRFLEGRPILARPIPWWQRIGKWMKRHPAATLSLSVIVVSVIAVLSIFLVYSIRLQAALDNALAKEQEANTQRIRAERLRKQAESDRETSLTGQQRLGLTLARHFLQLGHFAEAAKSLGEVPSERRGWEWHRMSLEAAGGPRKSEFIGCHGWAVTAMCLSRDGNTLVSSGQDGRVLLWDLRKRFSKPVELEQGIKSPKRRQWRHTSYIPKNDDVNGVCPDCFTDLSWLKDGELLVGVSLRKKAVLWDIRTGRRQRLFTHDRPLYAVAASATSDFVLCGDSAGTVLCHNVRLKNTKALQLSKNAVLCIRRIAGGWAVGQADGTLSILDPEAKNVLEKKSISGPVWGIAVGEDGRWLVVACKQTQLQTFRLESKTMRMVKTENYLVNTVGKHKPRALHTVSVGTDGSSIFAGDNLGNLIGWDRGNPQPRFVQPDQESASLTTANIEKLALPLQRRLSAIAVCSEQAIITAGANTALSRWDLKRKNGVTVVRVGRSPHILFDRKDPLVLWAGTQEGTLRRMNSRTGNELRKIQAHAQAIAGIGYATTAHVIVTCSKDKTIRFWKWTGNHINEVYPAIKHALPLRSIAITNDGKLVGGYDAVDTVHLWRLHKDKAELIRSVSLQISNKSAVGGLVTFNASGTLLAAAGPEQSVRIIPVNPKGTISVHDGNVAAARGATALAWHPNDTNLLIGGDTAGAIRTNRRMEDTGFLYDYSEKSWIGGLRFTPDGKRVVVANRNGNFFLLGNNHAGEVCSRRCMLPGDVVDAQFDPHGQRLALVHANGDIEIWESAQRSVRLKTKARWQWFSKLLCAGKSMPWREFGSQHVALDEQNRVWVLRDEFSAAIGAAGKDVHEIILGRETNEGYCEEKLGVGVAGFRWHALCASKDWVSAAIHRKIKGLDGNVFLYQHPTKRLRFGQPSLRGSLFHNAKNWGYRLHLLPGTGSFPHALHHSFDGYYLMWTRKDNENWKTTAVGWQGDGGGLRAVQGPDGSMRLLFGVHRFMGDPHPLVYVHAKCPPWQELTREVIASNAIAHSLTLAADGSPVISYLRFPSVGVRQLIVAERTNDRWTKAAALLLPHPQDSFVSNLVCGHNKTYYLAMANQRERTISLLSYQKGTWTKERVWREKSAVEPFADEETAWLVTLVLRIDSHNQPVLVAARHGRKQSWLRVFRATRAPKNPD